MVGLSRKHLPGWIGLLPSTLMLGLLLGQDTALAMQTTAQEGGAQTESTAPKKSKHQDDSAESEDEADASAEDASVRVITVLTLKTVGQKPTPLADVQVRVAGSGVSPEETGPAGTVQLPIATGKEATLHLFVTGMPTCKLTLPALAANELSVRILVEFVASNDKKVCKVSRLS